MGQAPSVLKSSAFYTKSPYCSKLKFMNKNERKKEVLLAQSTQRDKKKDQLLCPKNTCSLTMSWKDDYFLRKKNNSLVPTYKNSEMEFTEPL